MVGIEIFFMGGVSHRLSLIFLTSILTLSMFHLT